MVCFDDKAVAVFEKFSPTIVAIKKQFPIFESTTVLAVDRLPRHDALDSCQIGLKFGNGFLVELKRTYSKCNGE